jgi:hypothetical protein
MPAEEFEEPRTIVLPEEEDMLRRLQSVDDDPYMVQKLYPLILRHAGQEKQALGILLMLQLAICDFTEGLPPQLGTAVNMRLPNFVSALVDDETVKNEALKKLKELGIAQ